MRPSAFILALVAAVVGGCRTTPGSEPQDEVVPLPPATAAWLCADACRASMAGADPLPYHGGAPASRGDDGSFEICYQQRADGRWTPRADGRLCAVQQADGERALAVQWQPEPGLPGWQRPVAALVLRIVPCGSGARLCAEANGAAAEFALRHARAALQFAQTLLDGGAAVPCCARHANWQARALLQRAAHRRAECDLLAARSDLLAARALDPTLPGVDYRIGQLDRALGQDELAVPRLRLAAAQAADPALRAAAADEAGQSLARRDDTERGQRLRRDAHRRLTAGDSQSAEALALQARAEEPDPVADLQLRHRLAEARDDTRAALGTALLLREYAADARAEQLLADDLDRLGCDGLARRAGQRARGLDLSAAELLAALAVYGDFANAAFLRWVDRAGFAGPTR
jgi:hypothetical protein